MKRRNGKERDRQIATAGYIKERPKRKGGKRKEDLEN